MTRRALFGPKVAPLIQAASLTLALLLFLAACGPKGSYENVGPEELYEALAAGAVFAVSPVFLARGLRAAGTWK